MRYTVLRQGKPADVLLNDRLYVRESTARMPGS
ncbi:hypothetical protein HD596_000307 [Nonomuraea jabiensis]|uniref:Uncharacterized protein n=1 Tax=Nonomuraea jabiensis TaxID=882448 RepID=A0A7W9FXW5_9ACTN|nr:hypothetical protein [Nonomuraea jabiensis]